MQSTINAAKIERVFATKTAYPGTLISIVGFDGSGKTTQIEALAQKFRAAGNTVLETRQPTDWYRNETSVQFFHEYGGSKERARILSLFAAADRHRHIQEVVLPALERGDVVICDRYVYATFGVFIHRGVDPDFLIAINHGVPHPDHAFYLDVPTDVLMNRLAQRDGGKLKFEERHQDRIESIVATYQSMGSLLTRIDGTLSREAITETMWRSCDPHRTIQQ